MAQIESHRFKSGSLEPVEYSSTGAGRVSGGGITEDGVSQVDVAAGTGVFRTTNSDVGTLVVLDWPALAGVSIPEGELRYIGVEYNAGSPQVVSSSTNDFDWNTSFLLGIVVNDVGEIHILQDYQRAPNTASLTQRRFFETRKLERDNRSGGLILSESGDGNRNLALTAGSLWDILNRFTTANINTAGTDTFEILFHVAGQWSYTEDNTQWPNTQYDNGTNLVTMTNNHWANLWLYIQPEDEISGKLHMLYGTDEYPSQAQAETEDPPSDVPQVISEQCVLVGVLTFQKNATVAGSVRSAFVESFSATAASIHGNLSGLLNDDHPQYFLLDGRTGGQIAIGGIDPSDNLVLESTSDATKGAVQIQTGSDLQVLDFSSAGFVKNNASGIISGGNTISSSDITDFNEAAQDAVGSILTDTATVDLVYDDGTPQITANVIPGGIDHNSLANLTVGDPHTQYFLLAGRSGGQVAVGGTGASENLELSSTSNGTKGAVLIDDGSDFRFDSTTLAPFIFADYSLDRIGINDSTPSATLDLKGKPGTSANADTILIVGGGAGGTGSSGFNGGGISIQTGAGGAASGVSGVGGNSGSVSITLGAAGNATNTSGTGGTGGSLSITAGAGGSAIVSGGTGGVGGNLTVNPGAGGTGTSSNGSDGYVAICNSRGNVGIGTTTATSKLTGIGTFRWTIPGTSTDFALYDQSLDDAWFLFSGSVGEINIAPTADHNVGIGKNQGTVGALFHVGGYSKFDLNATFNDTSGSTGDLNVKSTTSDYMLFCDASASKVGINTSTAQSTLTINDSSPTLRLKISDSSTNHFIINHASFSQTTINNTAAASTSLIDINPIDSGGTSECSVRLFRSTNTSSTSCFFYMFKGDGTATTSVRVAVKSGSSTLFNASLDDIDFRISGDTVTDLFYVNAGTDFVGIGTSSPTSILHVNGAETWTEQSSTPSSPTSGTEMRVYMKADKFIIQFNDGGTVRYKYLDLTGTGVTWVATTTAP